MITQILKNSLLSIFVFVSIGALARTDANHNPVTEHLNECIKVLDQYNRRGGHSCSQPQPLKIDGVKYTPKRIPNPPKFKTPDEAAKGFQEFLKRSKLPQFVEYCAYITRTSTQEYTFTWYIQGSPAGCPILYYQAPPNTAANIHTHPHSGGSEKKLSHPFNSPSTSDLISAKVFAADQLSYMVAPHGHIYRYGPESSTCTPKAQSLTAELKIISTTRKNSLPVGMYKKSRLRLTPAQSQAVCPTI